MIYKP